MNNNLLEMELAITITCNCCGKIIEINENNETYGHGIFDEELGEYLCFSLDEKFRLN